MDVTRETFAEIYSSLKHKINTASFASFDLEMTGIWNTDPKSRNKKSDTPEQRYVKMASTASRYSIIQFGLCLFHETTSLAVDGSCIRKWKASPYNFYVFPDHGLDVVLSVSAIEFLRKNGMDFGKWMSSGVPFATEESEQWLRKKFMESFQDNAQDIISTEKKKDPIVLTGKKDIEFMKRNINDLATFIADDEKKEFLFEGCNNFLRKCLYQHMETNFPELIVSKNADNRICVRKMTDAEKAAHKEKLMQEAHSSFINAMGMRLIFNDLVEAKKPIVGHNLFFDILFTIKSFDIRLPEDLTTLKLRLDKLFPEIYDTKYVACSGALGDIYENTKLEDIYRQLVTNYTPSGENDKAGNQVLHVSFAEGFENTYGKQSFHNAGYDAYCTGAVFCQELLLGGGLTTLRKVTNKKLFMMQSLYHMDLNHGNPHGFLKVLGQILHVSNFPEDTKMDDVFKLFTAHGFKLDSRDIIWIDGESIFVCINTQDTVTSILERLSIPKRWKIISYKEYLTQSHDHGEKNKKETPYESAVSWLREMLWPFSIAGEKRSIED